LRSRRSISCAKQRQQVARPWFCWWWRQMNSKGPLHWATMLIVDLGATLATLFRQRPLRHAALYTRREVNCCCCCCCAAAAAAIVRLLDCRRASKRVKGSSFVLWALCFSQVSLGWVPFFSLFHRRVPFFMEFLILFLLSEVRVP
jgi:hypothetical protein